MIHRIAEILGLLIAFSIPIALIIIYSIPKKEGGKNEH
jgi:hypothetical protein